MNHTIIQNSQSMNTKKTLNWKVTLNLNYVICGRHTDTDGVYYAIGLLPLKSAVTGVAPYYHITSLRLRLHK